MTMKEVEEKFKKDTLWLMSELKQEELANAYSEYRIRFYMQQRSDEEPNLRSQRRIIKMLSDRKALSISPLFHRMSILDSALQMQGADPIGYSIQVQQPSFDEIFEEASSQAGIPPAQGKAQKLAQKIATDPDNKYFISLKKRQVVLNNTFILSTPNFNSENESFIEYVITHPNETLKREAMQSDLKVKFKKSFHSILGDLGFKGEIRKLFFDASKTAVQFKNFIPETELAELGIDAKKLAAELSVLERNHKKEEEMGRDTKK